MNVGVINLQSGYIKIQCVKGVKHSKTRLKIFKTCAAICDGVVHSWHFAFQSSEDGASPKWFHEDSSVHCDGCAH